MTKMNGKCASRGYASGNAIVKDIPEISVNKISVKDPYTEIEKFRKAQDVCDKRLEELVRNSEKAKWNEAADIFKSYQAIIHDENFYRNVFDRVKKELINIEYVLQDEVQKAVLAFEAIKSDYLRERATDIENACNELIHVMLGVNTDLSEKMAGIHDVVLVARDLTPSETVKLDKGALRGIVTERGGITSHTVILAKALGIPAVVGVRGAVKAIRDGDFILVDGCEGEVVVHPDEQAARDFAGAKKKYTANQRAYVRSESRPAVTKDGFAINVSVNTGDPAGIASVAPERCDGIGLLRTEFIFLNAFDYPDEETQFNVYKSLAQRVNGKAVVIRTLDIGGDKRAKYMRLPEDGNPFMGYRAIRMCLDRKDIFSVQLRAILRASAFGNVKIMFPMICCTEELLEAKACVEAEKQRLKNESIPFKEDISIGIMIETPASVLLSDKLARHSDFFSVGTNDLVQFVTAADRSNEMLSGIYDYYNISVLRLVKMLSENAEKAGIPWGICGEAASEEKLIPLWVAMGVKELSVAPTLVGEVKHLIRKLNRGRTLKDLDAVLNLESIGEVKEYLAAH